MIDKIAVGVSILIFVLVSLFAYDALSPTDWQLVKVQESGKVLYTIRSCHPVTGCYLTGYRWTMEQKEFAEERWRSFATPDPVITVVEVVHHGVGK